MMIDAQAMRESLVVHLQAHHPDELAPLPKQLFEEFATWLSSGSLEDAQAKCDWFVHGLGELMAEIGVDLEIGDQDHHD